MTMSERNQTARAPGAIDTGQDLDPPESRPNLPEEERLVRLLRLAVAASQDIEAAHGEDCACTLCHLNNHYRFLLQLTESGIAGELRVVPDGGGRPLAVMDADILHFLWPQISALLNTLAPGTLRKWLRRAAWRRAKQEYGRQLQDGSAFGFGTIWVPSDPAAVVHWRLDHGLWIHSEWSACGRDFRDHPESELPGSRAITCRRCLALLRKLGGVPAAAPAPGGVPEVAAVDGAKSENPFYAR